MVKTLTKWAFWALTCRTGTVRDWLYQIEHPPEVKISFLTYTKKDWVPNWFDIRKILKLVLFQEKCANFYKKIDKTFILRLKMKDSWRFERHEDWENLRWRQKLWIKSLFKWQSMVFYGKLPHFGPSLSRIMFDSYLKVIRSQFFKLSKVFSVRLGFWAIILSRFRWNVLR